MLTGFVDFQCHCLLGFMVRLKVAHIFTGIQYSININQKEAQNLFQIYVVNNILCLHP